MDNDPVRRESSANSEGGMQDKRESGEPGGGQGRRDAVGGTTAGPSGEPTIDIHGDEPARDERAKP